MAFSCCLLYLSSGIERSLRARWAPRKRATWEFDALERSHRYIKHLLRECLKTYLRIAAGQELECAFPGSGHNEFPSFLAVLCEHRPILLLRCVAAYNSYYIASVIAGICGTM
jgi:hypothetical protein